MSREKLLIHPRTLVGLSLNDASAEAMVNGITLNVVERDGVAIVTEDTLPEKRFDVHVAGDRVVGIAYNSEKFRVE